MGQLVVVEEVKVLEKGGTRAKVQDRGWTSLTSKDGKTLLRKAGQREGLFGRLAERGFL